MCTKEGKSATDIYYLRGALLVKGLADSEIQYDTIWMLPMTQGMPTAYLAGAFRDGPCSISRKMSFAVSSARGEISPQSTGVLAYEYIDSAPTTPSGMKGVRHEGLMKFTTPDAEPSADTDIRGYKLIGRSRPYPVVGSPDLPIGTIGKLRRWLSEKKSREKGT